jgi:hypothetical protein
MRSQTKVYATIRSLPLAVLTFEGFDSAGLKVNRFGWGGDDWSASVSLAQSEASKAAVGKRGRLRSSQAPLLLSHSGVRLSKLGTATAMPTAEAGVNSFAKRRR